MIVFWSYYGNLNAETMFMKGSGQVSGQAGWQSPPPLCLIVFTNKWRNSLFKDTQPNAAGGGRGGAGAGGGGGREAAFHPNVKFSGRIMKSSRNIRKFGAETSCIILPPTRPSQAWQSS